MFSALDRAQRRMGFHHADLGLRNVMEHYPVLWDEVEEATRQESQEAVRTGSSLTPAPAGDSAEGYEASQGAPHGPQQPQQPQQQSPFAAAAMQAAPSRERCGPCEAADTAGPEHNVAPQTAGGGGRPGIPYAVQPQEQPYELLPPLPSPPQQQQTCVPCRQMHQRHSHLRQPAWRRRIQGPTCPRIMPRPGYSCTEDGKRLPLGPQIEVRPESLLCSGVCVVRAGRRAGGRRGGGDPLVGDTGLPVARADCMLGAACRPVHDKGRAQPALHCMA